MSVSRCAADCRNCHRVTRRQFVAAASAWLASLPPLTRYVFGANAAPGLRVQQCGPASRYVPIIQAAFVRRKGEYGLRWPGQVYDGAAALKNYSEQITQTARQLNIQLELRPQPLYSMEESQAWIAQAAAAKPDGLVVVLLDRQEHAWPTAERAIDTKIPTVIFSPVGSSFTTNTAGPSRKPGCMIASTDDFRQVQYGMKMVWAGARMRKTRCLVIHGAKHAEGTLPELGIQLCHVPAKEFLEEYKKTPDTDEIRSLAAGLIQRATRQIGATEQDVLNGIKSYVVARSMLERYQADAITMDCLGALAGVKVSLPCIAWSKMNDDGIPAACEADLGAVASHVIVQYLFDRPGFQQDPVAETARGAIIGAHCSCPTRLGGFAAEPEPYEIVHHHALRDATARPTWKPGQRVTSVDVLLKTGERPTTMIISAGQVLENVAVPPAGGCVISVMVKFDGVEDVLAYPGFHQVFFYGDYKAQLVQFCRLFGIQPMVV
ncbi:MAG: hypothetical protein ACUVUC_01120 [Thermoguttaceae bacterium]